MLRLFACPTVVVQVFDKRARMLCPACVLSNNKVQVKCEYALYSTEHWPWLPSNLKLDTTTQ